LLRYYQTVATWPLQIYSSAIIFSPQTSAVRRDNLEKIPRWLRKLPQVEEAWASLIQTLAGHSDLVLAVAFSPDSKQIVSGSYDKTIKLWDATTGDLQKTLAGHSHSVWAVVFLPDSKRIASGSDDKTIKLWDVPESLKVSRLLSSTIGSSLKFCAWKEIKTSGIVNSLKFSKDGRRLVTNLGPIKIESVLADRRSPDYELLEDLWVGNQWIYYGAMPVLRLTSDFEPRCYDGRGNQAAIGLGNGRVLSFEIDRRSLHLALKESAYMYSNERVGR
jgi:hypothetical protein